MKNRKKSTKHKVGQTDFLGHGLLSSRVNRNFKSTRTSNAQCALRLYSSRETHRVTKLPRPSAPENSSGIFAVNLERIASLKFRTTSRLARLRGRTIGTSAALIGARVPLV